MTDLWEMTAKYGVPYFSNFINSDMNPEDARSMCCRLRIDNRELEMRGGGLFGSNPLTGSIGVITINMPRIGYLAKTKKDFLQQLAKLMDIAEGKSGNQTEGIWRNLPTAISIPTQNIICAMSKRDSTNTGKIIFPPSDWSV